ncbi:MAG: hypothetical protein EXS09_03025 [Gemmataceae bacterium]|nr:hypothetical protein [Gemmataceae bacterium]
MFDFFFGAASSSSSSAWLSFALRGVFLATPVAPAWPAFLPLVTPASSPSRSAGASTTKRYLHFGQSTFLPTRVAFTETFASQLGH